MLNSAILDVAIGLSFVFLLVSLLVTACVEMLSGALKWRSTQLWDGLERLLQSKDARDALYNHPLVKGLTRVEGAKPAWNAGKNGPSYIPSRTFALALLDLLRKPDDAATALEARLPASPELRAALRPLVRDAGDDVDRLRENVEIWFNDSMDRVSGWYKRRVAFHQAWLALGLAIFMNIDALQITRTLWREPTLRQALVVNAQAAAQTPPPGLGPAPGADAPRDRFATLQTEIGGLGLPIGWGCPTAPAAADERALSATVGGGFWCAIAPGESGRRWSSNTWWSTNWPVIVPNFAMMLFGWLLTAAATSLGAPFWFDTLKRVTSIRSSGKAPEERPLSPKQVPQPREPGQRPREADLLDALKK
jgi:hypothetical protein